MRIIARMLPRVQLEHLEHLRATASDSVASKFEFPLSPDTYPFYSDYVANSALKYKYGALPLADMRPKLKESKQKLRKS